MSHQVTAEIQKRSLTAATWVRPPTRGPQPARDGTGPTASIYERIPVHPDPARSATFFRSADHSCAIAPPGPRTCPFGGACHTCPARVQAKLRIGSPDDGFEREADAVADRVMRMPDPTAPRLLIRKSSATGTVRRAEHKEQGHVPVSGTSSQATTTSPPVSPGPAPRQPTRDETNIIQSAQGAAQTRCQAAASVVEALSQGAINPRARRVLRDVLGWQEENVRPVVSQISGMAVALGPSLHPLVAQAGDPECAGSTRGAYTRGGQVVVCPNFFTSSGYGPSVSLAEGQIRNLLHEGAHLAGVRNPQGPEPYSLVYTCTDSCQGGQNSADNWAHVVHCLSGQTADLPSVHVGQAPPGGTTRRAFPKRREAEIEAVEPATVTPTVETVLSSAGHPLDNATRAFMESRFGCGFGDVRIHDDSAAANSAASVSAYAYAVGRDVVFGAGQYSPSSAQGRRLLAHELTHVVQQGAASPPTATTAPPARDRLSRREEPRLRRARFTVNGATVSIDYGALVRIPPADRATAIETRYTSWTGQSSDPVHPAIAALSAAQQEWVLFGLDLLITNPVTGLDRAEAAQRLITWAPSSRFRPLGSFTDANRFNFEQEVLSVSGWFELALTRGLEAPTGLRLERVQGLINAGAPDGGSSACPATRGPDEQLNVARLRADLPPLLREHVRRAAPPATTVAPAMGPIETIADHVLAEAVSFFAPYASRGRGRGNTFTQNWRYSAHLIGTHTPAGAPREEVRLAYLDSRARMVGNRGLFAQTHFDPRCATDESVLAGIVRDVHADAAVQNTVDRILQQLSYTEQTATPKRVFINVQYNPATRDECDARWMTINTLCHELVHVMAHDDFSGRAAGRQIMVECFAEILGDQLYDHIRDRAGSDPTFRARFESGLTSGPCGYIPTSSPGYDDAGANAGRIRVLVGNDRFRAAYFLGRLELIGVQRKPLKAGPLASAEQEADHVADRITKMTVAPGLQRDVDDPERMAGIHQRLFVNAPGTPGGSLLPWVDASATSEGTAGLIRRQARNYLYAQLRKDISNVGDAPAPRVGPAGLGAEAITASRIVRRAFPQITTNATDQQIAGAVAVLSASRRADTGFLHEWLANRLLDGTDVSQYRITETDPRYVAMLDAILGDGTPPPTDIRRPDVIDPDDWTVGTCFRRMANLQSGIAHGEGTSRHIEVHAGAPASLRHSVLIHEFVHFYSHPLFREWLSATTNPRLYEEGFTAWLAARVPGGPRGYGKRVKLVDDIAVDLPPDDIARAYFRGEVWRIEARSTIARREFATASGIAQHPSAAEERAQSRSGPGLNQEVVRDQRYRFLNLGRDQAEPKPEHVAEFGRIKTRTIDQNPVLRIRFVGHASTPGSPAHNERLSRQRALAFYQMARTAGVPAPRLVNAARPEHHGETVPTLTEESPETRAFNRRVELFIDGGGVAAPAAAPTATTEE